MFRVRTRHATVSRSRPSQRCFTGSKLAIVAGATLASMALSFVRKEPARVLSPALELPTAIGTSYFPAARPRARRVGGGTSIHPMTILGLG